MGLKIGDDDGHGNKVCSFDRFDEFSMREGDIIQIKSKDGSVIATYIFTVDK